MGQLSLRTISKSAFLLPFRHTSRKTPEIDHQVDQVYLSFHTLDKKPFRRRATRRVPFNLLANGKEHPMFTRVVEITSKSGKESELANTIQEKVLPILRKQTGFVDETVLTSDTNPNHMLGISFWNTKDDAERYHREQFPRINEMLLPLTEGAPVVRTYNVQTSTPHRITAGKAA
jgi:heme-degrading monooxygenase HmoA